MSANEKEEIKIIIHNITDEICSECGNNDWKQDLEFEYPIFECRKCGNRVWSD